MKSNYSAAYSAALQYAKEMHDATGRLWNGLPYVGHPIAVANFLIENVKNEKLDWFLIIQVALLHDVLEDTKATYQELCNRFGKKVADGVAASTKNKSLPKEEQIPESLVRIKKQPKEIWLVKVADRCLNVSNLKHTFTINKALAYCSESLLIYKGLKSADEALANILVNRIDAYMDIIDIKKEADPAWGDKIKKTEA